MAKEDKDGPSAIVKASLWYVDKTVFQAAVQGIPVVGGSLSTLLGGAGARYKEQRVLHFIEELKAELVTLKEVPAGLDQEGLADFLVDTIEKAARSRSAEKRSRFARLVAGQVTQPRSWDEAEMSARLLDDLSDLHIKVLAAAVSADVRKACSAFSIKIRSVRSTATRSTSVGSRFEARKEPASHSSVAT